jgi:hypothetical protein
MVFAFLPVLNTNAAMIPLLAALDRDDRIMLIVGQVYRSFFMKKRVCPGGKSGSSP